MLIWYLQDGLNKVTDKPAKVVAVGLCNLFIMEEENVLKAIPEHIVTAKLYENANDELPLVTQFINDNYIERIDYTLVDMFATVH